MGVPVNSLASPRFCGVRTFQRLPHSTDCSGNDFAVLGASFGTATSYRPGCRFGPVAIRDASSTLKSYHSVPDVDTFEHCQGVDTGDVDIIPGYLDESFERIEAATAGVLDAGVVPVIMDGDHSITLPELRAVTKRHGPVALLHFDARSDTGDDFFDKPYNHGTTFYWAIKEGLIFPEQSTQAGTRGSLYSRSSLNYAKGKGMRVISGWEPHDIGVDETTRIVRERTRLETPVFITFNTDFLDAAYASETGTPETGGFTIHEALKLILGVCPGQCPVGMDLVEVLPDTDSAGIISFAVAGIMHAFLACLATNKKHNPS